MIVKSLSNRSKYFSIFLSIISLLVFLYVFYKAEIVYQGDKNSNYLKYYLISSFSTVFWLIMTRINSKTRSNIILFFISGLVGLYIVEFMLDFNFKSNGDTRSKRQVVQDLRAVGINAVPTMHPSTFVRDGGLIIKGKELYPLAGISNSHTVFCNESGQYSKFISDRYGFNNPDQVWNVETYLVLVGDSFTHGACVNTGEDIAGHIRNYTKKNVVNLGYSGNGPLLELASLKEYASTIKPKHVFWLYYEGNDLVGKYDSELQVEMRSETIFNYLKSDFSQDLINKQGEIDIELKKIVDNKINLKSSDFTRLLRLVNLRKAMNLDFNKYKDTIKKAKVANKNIFLEILHKANKQVESWGGKFYFVYLPEFSRYAEHRKDHSLYRNRNELLESVDKLNIDVIDVHQEIFNKEYNPLLLFPNQRYGHYTSQGYNLIAKKIINKIEENE